MMDINTAVRIIRNHIFDYLREMRGGRNAGRTGLIEAANTIYDYANEKEKHRWHDLRKDPEDLPEPHTLCIICVKRWSKITDDWIIGDYKLTEFTDEFEYAKGWYGLPEPEVLAWKYFELFEPIEEDT